MHGEPSSRNKAKAEKCNGYHYLLLGEFHKASEDRASSCKCPMLTLHQLDKLQIEEIGYHPQGSWHDALCSQKPGEDIGSPGGVVTGASEAPSIGNAN